jgi:hypothetical protein
MYPSVAVCCSYCSSDTLDLALLPSDPIRTTSHYSTVRYRLSACSSVVPTHEMLVVHAYQADNMCLLTCCVLQLLLDCPCIHCGNCNDIVETAPHQTVTDRLCGVLYCATTL